MGFQKSIREKVYIKIPLAGTSSGGGKTYKSLRLDAKTSEDIEDKCLDISNDIDIVRRDDAYDVSSKKS